MTYLVIIEKDGDAIDTHYFCSDSCAQTDPEYKGWYGAGENYSARECFSCEQPLYWINEEAGCTYLGNQPAERGEVVWEMKLREYLVKHLDENNLSLFYNALEEAIDEVMKNYDVERLSDDDI